MRLWLMMSSLSLATALFSGCSDKQTADLGLAYSGETRVENARLLVDEAWTDPQGNRCVSQEIFDEVFSIINEAEEFILLDFFLVNEFLYEPGPNIRKLSQELTDQLLTKREESPEVQITFITDPVNTVYGAIESPQFQALEAAGVKVVWTDLDRLRDSNPLYSSHWNLFVKRFGVGPGSALKNPMGEGRISLRSLLKLLNFKANHRKVLVTDKSLLLTSANPHSASSAHWNVALRVDGAGQRMALEAESAVLGFSAAEGAAPSLPALGEMDEPSEGHRLQLLTEGCIKEHILTLLNSAESGARIDLTMFYLSHRGIIAAFIKAKERGCDVRVILDPSKDAFGRIKNGIPNRQSAAKLMGAGIPVRWADTHGEQCHVKMLYVERPDQTATLMLGSCNYTRRNMDNFNCEANLALTAPADDPSMARARDTFERWWNNPDGKTFTTEYATFEDSSPRRKLRAWLMERTGLCTF